MRMLNLRKKTDAALMTNTTLTIALALLIGTMLAGCASSKPDWPNAGSYGINRTAGAKFSKPPTNRPPPDPALHKELPEMTAADYEASGDLHLGNDDASMAFV